MSGSQDLRLENAQLKEQLHRIRQVCDLQSKLGEDTEFEVRELKRKLAEFVEVAGEHVRHYETVACSNQGCDLQSELTLCNASIKRLKDLLSRIQGL